MEYSEELKRAYLGEWFGRGLLGALAESSKWADEVKALLAVLALLEEVTRRRIEPIAGHLASAAERIEAFELGKESSKAYAVYDWLEWIRRIVPPTQQVAERYRLLRDMAPERDRQAAEFLYVHEIELLNVLRQAAAEEPVDLGNVLSLIASGEAGIAH